MVGSLTMDEYAWIVLLFGVGHSRVRAELAPILAHGSFSCRFKVPQQALISVSHGSTGGWCTLDLAHSSCLACSFFSRRSCMLVAMFWMDSLFLASALGPVWSRPGFTSPAQLIRVVMRALAETDPGSEGVVFSLVCRCASSLATWLAHPHRHIRFNNFASVGYFCDAIAPQATSLVLGQ